MNYAWQEYSENYNGETNPKYTIRIDYNDGTPCWDHLNGTIHYRNNTWQGMIEGCNQMAEFLSNGWETFFRIEDDNLDYVFDELNAYIDELVDSGNVPQEWVEENSSY